MPLKLYKVTIERTYEDFVLAESPEAARRFVRDIVRDGEPVEIVTERQCPTGAGLRNWLVPELSDLVYGTAEDVTGAEAVAAVDAGVSMDSLAEWLRVYRDPVARAEAERKRALAAELRERQGTLFGDDGAPRLGDVDG